MRAVQRKLGNAATKGQGDMRNVTQVEGPGTIYAPHNGRGLALLMNRKRKTVQRTPKSRATGQTGCGCLRNCDVRSTRRSARDPRPLTHLIRLSNGIAPGLEFPGFSGDGVCAAYGPLRIARDSDRPGDCGGGFDCRRYRCRKRPRRSRDPGSCRFASLSALSSSC